MTEMNENNMQLISDLILLLPQDMHRFRTQLMSGHIIGQPIIHLIETLEDYIVNEVITQSMARRSETTTKMSDNSEDNCEEMCVKCEAILDKMWETINCCDWSEVVIDFRHCFAFISLIKALLKIWSTIGSNDNEMCFQQKFSALRQLDSGLIMSPKLTDSNILAKFATIIHKSITDCELNCKRVENICVFNEKQKSFKRKSNDNQLNTDFVDNNRQKVYKRDKNIDSMEGLTENRLNDSESESQTTAKLSIDSDLHSIIPYFKNCDKNGIKRVKDLDLDEFRNSYMKSKRPVIITDCISDWPAMGSRKWTVDYILKVAAYRTVPIEIGSKYTDEDWSQKLMTIKEFINQFILNTGADGSDSSTRIGYLAQHNLFDQIEELNRDFSVPDYCSLTDADCVDVDINAWFGPKGTVSPLHYDPKDNLLVQVLGQKYIRLYSDETPPEAIYPNDCRLLFNTSQIDFENFDSKKFPNFEKLDNYYECVLNEGEVLYMPDHYWHFVKSLSTSFSLSFWWK